MSVTKMSNHRQDPAYQVSMVTCGTCNGTGKEILDCEFCGGSGTREHNSDGADVECDCGFCQDSKGKQEWPCETCEGSGQVPDDREPEFDKYAEE
jgi:DnaJ-class molecular chaperone